MSANELRHYGLVPVIDPTGEYRRRLEHLEPSGTELYLGDVVTRLATGRVTSGWPGQPLCGAVVGIQDRLGTPQRYYPGRNLEGWRVTVACDPFQDFIAMEDSLGGANLTDPGARGQYAAINLGLPDAMLKRSGLMIDSSSLAGVAAGLDLVVTKPLAKVGNTPDWAFALWVVRIANHQDMPAVAAGGVVVPGDGGTKTWNISDTFVAGDIVAYNGNLYRTLATNSGNFPTNPSFYTLLYEPPISPKRTAFNVDFGTTATTAARGNHAHNLADLAERSFASLTNVPPILSMPVVDVLGNPGSTGNLVSEQGIREAVAGFAPSDILDFIVESQIPAEIARDSEVAAAVAGLLTANAPIAPGTHAVITYDANGLVTGGQDLQESDIPTEIARASEIPNIVTSIGTPGTDTDVPSEAAVRMLLDSIVSAVGGAIHDPVADIASAKALDTTTEADFPSGMLMLVEDSGLFRLDRDSVSAEDEPNVLAPTAGPGRWIRMTAPLSAHALLTGIQGGTTGEHYHLTAAELAKLALVVDATTSNKGLVELATQPETTAGTDATRAVTPATLAGLLAARIATTTARGLVELATSAEALTGTDAERAVVPAALAHVLDNRPATTGGTGLVELATTAETQAGTDATRAVTPAGLQSVIDNTLSGDFMAVATYDPTGAAGDVFDADNHVYDNTISGLTATNVQAAIDEVAAAGTVSADGLVGTFQMSDGAGAFVSAPLRVHSGLGSIKADSIRSDADLSLQGGALTGYYDRRAVANPNSTYQLNVHAHRDWELTPAGNTTFSINSMSTDAASVAICTIVLHNAGLHELTWPTGAVWIGTDGAAPTFQTSGTDVVTMRVTSSSVLLFHAGSSN